MPFRWPPGFPRVPDDEWTRARPEALARKYDAVEKHGWYANLDPTVAQLQALLRPGDVMVDYSGGTGILLDRLFGAMSEAEFGVVNVDSSPKFLALCLEKYREDGRVAFRLLRYLKEEKRLQHVDEVLEAPLRERGVDVLVSTNAIHLYYELEETLRSWRRVVRGSGRVLVQSGNIRLPAPLSRGWIIDDTVAALEAAARRRVQEDAAFARHRGVLGDAARMVAHDALRRKYFLPPRPLAFYEQALSEAGFRILSVETRAVTARTSEWFDFLSVYHEGILGWVGGVEKVEGHAASPQDVEDRLLLMREALAEVLGGRETFDATWTYLTCAPA